MSLRDAHEDEVRLRRIDFGAGKRGKFLKQDRALVFDRFYARLEQRAVLVDGHAAVSYTHLDVYKRQIQMRG